MVSRQFYRKRRDTKSFVRRGNFRYPKKRILIVCEGARTGPYYFKGFKITSVQVNIRGKGMNTDSLVEEAIRLNREAEKEKVPYDSVWCVFDRNSFPLQNFTRAFQIAENHNIKVAYSNEAFELWYLLHFHYYDAALSRSQYKGRLSRLLGKKYEKNSKTMYDDLLDKQQDAIKNAEKLLKKHFRKENPSTTVHLLVEELNQYV
ncbi:RloB family protein [Desulfobacterales bacterium HSG2]|nr:RloB family protein [Desulfobacterales bacterium HSG2]